MSKELLIALITLIGGLPTHIQEKEMNKTTYFIISSILCGTVIIGGRLWLGLNFVERIIALVMVGGLSEVIYQKIKIKLKN